MSAGNEQTELRALARVVERGYALSADPLLVDLLRRAADRLDRLTTLVADLELNGDA